MSTTPGTSSPVRSMFREAIAADANAVRELKPKVKAEQRAQLETASKLQSRLAHLRRDARARHLAYSLWKGRCWAEIENNRPDGDPYITYAVAKSWKEVAAAAGETGPPPENLRTHIQAWL